MNAKRVMACTLFGFVAGIICWVGSYVAGGLPAEFSAGMILAIIFNRAFVGFAIGVSGWRAPWPLHGVVIGLVGSLPISVYPHARRPRGLFDVRAGRRVVGLFDRAGRAGGRHQEGLSRAAAGFYKEEINRPARGRH